MRRRPELFRPWVLVLWVAACSAPTAPAPVAVRVAHEIAADGGAVACVDRHAARIGAEVLARGGNAVDATVAMSFALAVTWPPAGNLGGGGVMVVALADGRRAAIDARETAPAGVGPDLFLGPDGRYDPARSEDPWLCVGVPGSVRGLALAHETFGTRPWAELVWPAVVLARDGFVVDATLSRWLEDVQEAFAAIPASRDVFLDVLGRTPAAGTRLVQPDLAETLQAIALGGADSFYEGPIAQRLAADVQQHGGHLTEDDLRAYRAVLREPVTVPFRGHTLLGMPPPSSGGLAVGQVLAQLERLDAAELVPGGPGELHALAEAARRAFADRADWLGDPDHVRVPLARLLSPGHIAAMTATFDRLHATSSHTLGPALWDGEGNHTTHLSAIDAAGNAVAFTTTLEAVCGGKAVAAGTGVLLNNQLRDFNRVPGRTDARGFIGTDANLAAPGKRPLSSMSPTIVLDAQGRVVLVTGSPGGRSIVSTVAQVVLAVVGRRWDLATAVKAPRMHHGWFPDEILIEPGGADPAVVAELRARGHVVRFAARTGFLQGTQGAAHSVAVDAGGRRRAVGDPRRDGWAAVAEPVSARAP